MKWSIFSTHWRVYTDFMCGMKKLILSGQQMSSTTWNFFVNRRIYAMRRVCVASCNRGAGFAMIKINSFKTQVSWLRHHLNKAHASSGINSNLIPEKLTKHNFESSVSSCHHVFSWRYNTSGIINRTIYVRHRFRSICNETENSFIEASLNALDLCHRCWDRNRDAHRYLSKVDQETIMIPPPYNLLKVHDSNFRV